MSKQYSFYSLAKQGYYKLAYFLQTREITYDNIINQYREELLNKLSKDTISYESIILKSSFLDNEKLWDETMHLNEKGYMDLAEELADKISSLINEKDT